MCPTPRLPWLHHWPGRGVGLKARRGARVTTFGTWLSPRQYQVALLVTLLVLGAGGRKGQVQRRGAHGQVQGGRGVHSHLVVVIIVIFLLLYHTGM